MGFGNQNSGQSLRGSSDILAALDSHITVERKQDEEDLLVIKQTKLRQAEALKPFEVKVLKNEDGPTGFEFSGLHDEKKKKAEEAMEAIVNLLVDGTKSRPEIHDTLGQDLGKGAIDDGIKLGIGQGKIEKVPKGELPSTLTLQQRKSNYLRLVQLS